MIEESGSQWRAAREVVRGQSATPGLTPHLTGAAAAAAAAHAPVVIVVIVVVIVVALGWGVVVIPRGRRIVVIVTFGGDRLGVLAGFCRLGFRAARSSRTSHYTPSDREDESSEFSPVDVHVSSLGFV
jgi:hypothetical protein